MDLNPVIALPEGPLVVDARVRVESYAADPALPAVVGQRPR